MRVVILFLLLFISLSAVAQLENGSFSNPTSYSEESIDKLNLRVRDLLEEDPEKAFSLGKLALEYAQQKNYQQGIAEAMTNLGFYHQDQANYSNAFDHFSKTEKIYREQGDQAKVAKALRNLGGLYRQRSLYREAEHYYLEALTIGDNLSDSIIIGSTLKDLGGLAYFTKDYNNALNYLNKSLSYIQQDTDPTTYAAAVNNLGVVYKAKRNYKLSLQYLSKSYELLKKENNIRDLSAVLMNIGEVHQRLGQLDEAEKRYLEALAAAKEVNSIPRLVEAYEYLSGFYAMLQEYDLAFDYKTLYASYKDSLYRQEADLRMAKIAKELELERKERAFSKAIQDKEVQLLSRQNQINNLELHRKNNLVLFSILLVLLVTGGAFALYKSYRIKQLQNRQLGIKNSEIGLKNTQLQEMNERLQSSEKQLKSLNETKDMFFGILAHDLRSPLHTLKGFVQLLNQGSARLTPAEISKLTGRIEHSLQGITSLLDNLLQWSTTQTGLVNFTPRKLELDKVLEENIQLLESTAQVKDIKLQKEIGATHLMADRQMLHLILRNLVGNAIKFTPRGGTVTIATAEDQQATYIKVIDTGVGMKPPELEQLFAEGRVKSNRGTENEKGSGLGLWLCKDFVERHNGSLNAVSEPGNGTTFIVRFPRRLDEGLKRPEKITEKNKKPAV